MKYIHFKDNKWRFIGRRANIFDAINGMIARKETPEILAENLGINLNARTESIDFIKNNPELEKEHEQRMLNFYKNNSK